jgi:hypothetical protein
MIFVSECIVGRFIRKRSLTFEVKAVWNGISIVPISVSVTHAASAYRVKMEAATSSVMLLCMYKRVWRYTTSEG